MRVNASSTRRRLLPLLAAVSVAVLAMALVPGAGASDGPPLDVRGFANGQTLHVGALEDASGLRVTDVEVAWAGASVDADANGLGTANLNELNRVFQPALNNKHTHARGSGLEIGVGTTPEDPNQAIVNQSQAPSESSAPPSSNDQDELLSAGVDPLVFAAVLRSNTVANWNDSGLVPGVCVLGQDLSRGQAYAAGVELIDAASDPDTGGLEEALLATTAQNPDRAVSQNTTRTRLVPTGVAPNNFGLMTEVRQTIAPITLLDIEGVPEELKGLTIELLGEWVLRVTATGHAGGATVHYGPGEASPETAILRVLNDVGEVLGQLTTQDIPIFGEEGFDTGDIGIPTDLIEVVIGENPRALAAPGETPDDESDPVTLGNGTMASAAVDVVRVKLLNQLPDIGELADVRLGHMEALAQVPVGGINCPIPVDKTAAPSTIQINGQPDTSRATITVHNPYECDLTNVVLVDEIRQKEGDPDFQLVASSPTADSPSMPTGNLTSADVVWSLGTIPAGGEKSVTLDLKSATRGGIIRDIARASGTLAACDSAETGIAVADISLVGASPEVEVAIETPRTGAPAAATTATGSIIALVATTLGVMVRRRIR